MDLEQALLQDVFDDPDEDTPRLVLADWMMEQGDPARQAWGEFIRVQCLLRHHHKPGTPERQELKRRERELQERFERLWMAELPVQDWSFCRGLIGLWLEPWTLARIQGLATLAQWPYVNELHLTSSYWSNPRRSAGPGQVRELRLLFRSPYLERIEVLDLSKNAIDDSLAADFLEAPLDRVRHLALSGNRLGPNTARALVTSQHLGGLEYLNLAGNPTLPPVWRTQLLDRFGGRVHFVS